MTEAVQLEIPTSESGFLALVDNELSVDWRAGYQRIEEFMLSLPQQKIRSQHRFFPGMMCREIFIPAGIVLLGISYKVIHPVFITQGRLLSFTPKEGLQYLRAGDQVTALPENPRIGYIYEDVIWTNVLPNPSNHTDPRAVLEECCFDAHKIQL